MDKPTLVLDWLAEGVAEVGDDGRLHPCNAAMSRLLERCAPEARRAEDVPWSALPLSPEAARMLASGDGETTLDLQGERWRLSGRTDGGRRWLIAAPADPPATDRAGERARMLAALGGGLVHELANRIGVIIGYADEVERRLPVADQTHLHSLTTAATDSLSLLRTLAHLLDRDPTAVQPIDLEKVVQDAGALLQKHAQRSHARIVVERGPVGAVSVRLPLADLVQATVAAVLFALRSTAGAAITLGVERRTAGRARACIRIGDLGDRAPFEALAAALERPDHTVLPALMSVPGSDTELLRVVMLLRRGGGDLEVEVQPTGRALRLFLPEVGR